MEEANDPLKNLNKLKDAALSCVQCGQCRVANWPSKGIFYVCPVYNTNLTPKFEPFFARGKNIIIRGLLWGDLELSSEISDILFQCTLCGSCYEFCFNAQNENFDFVTHRLVDHINVYEALRADLVEAGFGIEAQGPMNKAMVELLNPYERDNKDKFKWTEQLGFKVKNAYNEDADVLYFVGCTAALTPEIQSVAVATAKILNKLGIDFSIFGEKEICCGSVAMRTGNRKAFNTVAEENAILFKEKGVKKIITSCAGCYRTFKKDYGGKLDGIEIFHSFDYIKNILAQKDVKLKSLDIKSTYHDPCHIGRHMGLYLTPRELLSKISNFTEMKTNCEAAMCCGAGGGLKKGFPELSLEMAKNRIKEAEATGASFLVSTCPFCYRNLSDAIRELNSDIIMVDLVELLLESLNT